jgi:hypothetical protein
MIDPDMPKSSLSRARQAVTIAFQDKPVLTHNLQRQKGINLPLTNDEILSKWRMLFRRGNRRRRVEKD